MPLVDRDPDPVRRFCRKNGIALTKIVRVERGQPVWLGSALWQGDDGNRRVKEGDPALKPVYCECAGGWQWSILVVKGEEPKTYEEFCAIAQNWDEVKGGSWKL